MKRNEIKIEDALQLPSGSEKEMEQALSRIYDRLRSNTSLHSDQNSTEAVLHSSAAPKARWKRIAVVAAAALVIVAVGIRIQKERRLGMLTTADGVSHQIFQRTTFGQDGGVLTLRDGSRVEIRAGSHVLLERAPDGVRVLLNEGSIIVNAVKQRQGHLYVQTRDMTVSVVGTVFVVKAEKAGSRVAVVQGEVKVREGDTEKDLRPGEHIATLASLELPSVREEVAWSPHAEEHVSLLQQATASHSAPVPEWQIAAGGQMSFEVVSVRPSDGRDLGLFPLSNDNTYRQTGGYFRASFPLTYYIAFAYKLSPERRESWLSQMPKWAKTDNFAIEARAPLVTPTKDQMRLMVQSLLAERFKLAIRYEPQEVPVFALKLLTAGRLGPQIRPHREGPPCPMKRDESELFPAEYDRTVWPFSCGAVTLSPPGWPGSPAERKASAHNLLFAGRDISLELFFTDYMERPIVNDTGLTGNFDIRMEYAPEPGSIWLRAGPNAQTTEFQGGPTYLEALKDQLGMKLEATKARIPVLVVDHVQKPSEN
jgi:uncharacterized protein (TIGR03435 family)